MGASDQKLLWSPPDTPTCARTLQLNTPLETVLSRYLSRLSRGLAWHWEAGPGEGVVVG